MTHPANEARTIVQVESNLGTGRHHLYYSNPGVSQVLSYLAVVSEGYYDWTFFLSSSAALIGSNIELHWMNGPWTGINWYWAIQLPATSNWAFTWRGLYLLNGEGFRFQAQAALTTVTYSAMHYNLRGQL